MRRPIIVLAAALVVLSFGCQREGAVTMDTAMTAMEPVAVDTAAIEGEVTRIRDQWVAAAEKDDAATVATLYGEDAVFDAPDIAAAIAGREAIQEHLAKLFPSASNVQVRSTDLEIGTDLAYDYGEYTQRITPPKGQPIEQRGRYLVTLKRHDDGWKIDKHISFPISPAPAAASPARR